VKKLDHYLENAIQNIEDDRKVTRELLDDVVGYLSKSEERHREVGAIAAKYVETLQRSNEQLVKVSTIIHKQQMGDTGLSEDDKADIFDMLQEKEETK
jgi:F0F1-type ATP synthase membrane subunit b/b'|tara:strand:- start:446 stop:739 length:294 start_codon:yes stop_codon:yes gene_type:complete